MPPAYRPYQRDDAHGYAPGVFPTLELLASPVVLEAVVLPQADHPNEGLARIAAEAARRGLAVIRGDRLLAKLSGADDCLAVGVFAKPKARLDADRDHLVLVEPADQGNLGTILRTALGFGVRDLALIGTCCDPWHPRTVRASMGAIFHHRLERFATWADYAARFARAVHPFMTDGAADLPGHRFAHPCSLVFGNESAGLPSSFAAIGRPLRIPHAAAIDSLNLALAAGIGLWELSRQRNPSP